MDINKKFYLDKVTAMGEVYRLTKYEYIEVNRNERTGVIRNNFTNAANKYLQGGKYVENLRFKREEINRQFVTLNK